MIVIVIVKPISKYCNNYSCIDFFLIVVITNIINKYICYKILWII